MGKKYHSKRNHIRYFEKTYNRKTVLIRNGIDKPVKKEAEEIIEKFGGKLIVSKVRGKKPHIFI